MPKDDFTGIGDVAWVLQSNYLERSSSKGGLILSTSMKALIIAAALVALGVVGVLIHHAMTGMM